MPCVRVATESRELILNCCTEFIHLISSEANDVCNQHNKKTISAEHVLLGNAFIFVFMNDVMLYYELLFTALDRLGFSDYKLEAEAVLKDCKAVAAKRRRQSTRLENLGIPEEELLRQQQELFARAREEQALADQVQWQTLQQATAQQTMASQDEDSDDY